MHQRNDFGYPIDMNMGLQDDNPDLTEIRATRPSDIAILENIDLKCQETPMDRAELQELIKAEGVHGLLAIRKFQNVGFCLFNVQEEGRIVFLNRFSVALAVMDLGVAQKMIDSLRSTDIGDPATLRTIISENEIGYPVFDKMLSLGFVSTGIAPSHFYEYSRVFGTDRACDGLKLELA